MSGTLGTVDDSILELDSVSSGYRARQILSELSLNVGANDHIALIGANGCGKSTMLRTIVNLVPDTKGVISFLDTRIERLPTDQIVRMGMGYLKQNGNIFQKLSVYDNLVIAAGEHGMFAGRSPMVLDCFSVLRDRMQVRAGLLSGGQRQSLAIAMILMRPVSLLLLDEPIAGLSPIAARELTQSLSVLRERFSFASIMVEHRLRRIQPLVNRLVVMRSGQIIEDTADTVRMLDADWLDERYRHVPA